MIEIINKKSLLEIKEEKEKEKEDIQADTFEVLAMLYEEVEELRSENINLRNRVEQLERCEE
ncbi:hypothetical protein KQI88_10045 [Alkaliphilus sp. MSJ-5]|uniref:Uncharacterized protein n=1 Tax=Alkaliphilus flagellatus TaxID=2841507 RepID=A0ABS6G2Q2_9FIRM|nr:hypothetical protein [Alkaliphilus flagellatus]MBU5676760.1 hypothetical protein [Alkaliphilus flagellatus]